MVGATATGRGLAGTALTEGILSSPFDSAELAVDLKKLFHSKTSVLPRSKRAALGYRSPTLNRAFQPPCHDACKSFVYNARFRKF